MVLVRANHVFGNRNRRYHNSASQPLVKPGYVHLRSPCNQLDRSTRPTSIVLTQHAAYIHQGRIGSSIMQYIDMIIEEVRNLAGICRCSHLAMFGLCPIPHTHCTTNSPSFSLFPPFQQGLQLPDVKAQLLTFESLIPYKPTNPHLSYGPRIRS